MDDLLVVGAGIIGLSCAFEAASRGMRVRVLDRGSPGAGASGVAAGMLAPLAEAHDMPDEWVRIGVQSAELYGGFIERVEVMGGPAGFLSRGTLLVAADRDQARDLDQLERAHERLGMAAERISIREVIRREPALSPRVAGALWCADDHAVNPAELCAALVRAIRALGGTIETGVHVEGVSSEGPGLGVRVVGAKVDTPRLARRVLVAAGLHSAEVLPIELRSELDMGLRPVKGQVLILKGDPLISRVVRTPRVYLVPRGNRLVVGASEEEVGHHSEPLAGVTMDLLYEAWRTVPGVYELELEQIVVGHRPSTRDGCPVVRPVGPEGLFVATGHHRHGILLAPWTAHVFAQWLDSQSG
ncbi:MAG: glycine oxidase ThiO [Myxococcota bacterium]